jgi:Mrp family chromosome partitioning ATPase
LNASAVGKRIILVASGTRQTGRTTLAIWLAATCARINHRIALIDADVENPSIAQLLGIQPVAGWELFSTRDQPIDEYLVDSIADRFTVLPCTDSHHSGWPNSWDLASILEGLRDHYDAILVDMPPLARSELGAQMLDDCAPFVDAALWLDTSPMETRWALKQLQTVGVQMLGLVQRAQLAARAA